jgi:hypothetical protein
VLRYLAAMASATSGARGGTKGQLPPLAHKVLESTPLLEVWRHQACKMLVQAVPPHCGVLTCIHHRHTGLW